MKSFFKSILKDIPPLLNIFFIGALIIVFIEKFWLSHIPEWFSWGAEFGEIMENILLSIVAGYIFYFIIEFLTLRKEKKMLEYLISNQIEKVYTPFKSFMDGIRIVTDSKFSLPISEEELRAAFSKFDGYNSSIIEIKKGERVVNSWMNYLEQQIKTVNTEIDKLRKYDKFFDLELRVIIDQVESNELLKRIKTYKTFDGVDKALNYLIRDLKGYSDLIHKLECYQSEHYSFKFERDYIKLLLKSKKRTVSFEDIESYEERYKYPGPTIKEI